MASLSTEPAAAASASERWRSLESLVRTAGGASVVPALFDLCAELANDDLAGSVASLHRPWCAVLDALEGNGGIDLVLAEASTRVQSTQSWRNRVAALQVWEWLLHSRRDKKGPLFPSLAMALTCARRFLEDAHPAVRFWALECLQYCVRYRDDSSDDPLLRAICGVFDSIRDAVPEIAASAATNFVQLILESGLVREVVAQFLEMAQDMLDSDKPHRRKAAVVVCGILIDHVSPLDGSLATKLETKLMGVATDLCRDPNGSEASYSACVLGLIQLLRKRGQERIQDIITLYRTGFEVHALAGIAIYALSRLWQTVPGPPPQLESWIIESLLEEVERLREKATEASVVSGIGGREAEVKECACVDLLIQIVATSKLSCHLPLRIWEVVFLAKIQSTVKGRVPHVPWIRDFYQCEHLWGTALRSIGQVLSRNPHHEIMERDISAWLDNLSLPTLWDRTSSQETLTTVLETLLSPEVLLSEAQRDRLHQLLLSRPSTSHKRTLEDSISNHGD